MSWSRLRLQSASISSRPGGMPIPWSTAQRERAAGQPGSLRKSLQRDAVRRWMNFRAIRHPRSRGFVGLSFLEQEHQALAHLRGPQFRADCREVAIGDHAVEQRARRGTVPCARSLEHAREVLVDEALDLVEILDAGRFQDVRDLSGVVAGEPPAVDLALQRSRDGESHNAPAAAILSDLTQPVLAFRPVAPLAGGDLEDAAKVVGEETEHDELRMEPLGVLEQRVVFLLG